ncbi:primosomal protein DnaI [Shimazuella kribbensis]|uniref:primosomal protein DnaI n=1 Tax=Shimazuella kribbensis TaxID=139808 RepID=UPI0004116920|nr:primosomal protein DnaI [Shimazuella kribbensis]
MKHLGSEAQVLFQDKIQSYQDNWLKIMKHPLICDFQKEYPEVTASTLKRSIPKLKQYIKDQEQCSGCKGLETCPNMVEGHCSQLVEYGGFIDLQMKKCRMLEMYESQQRRKRLIKSHKIPKDVLEATFQSIQMDEARMQAITEVIGYSRKFKDELPATGLYLHGSFGTGKSYLAGALMNHLSEIGIDSYMAYVPDFIQAVYATFKEGTTNELIEDIKQVKVLILDDIGAETLSQWSRDDFLGNVLQHRMADRLPTIFTSNLTLDELETHLSYTSKGPREPLKAGRIMERIRHYTKPVQVLGHNRRLGAV